MLKPQSPTSYELKVTINGKLIERSIETHICLLDFLRDELGLTGTKEVCGEGECGACNVLLDGKIVNSCLIFAVETHNKSVVTIEGISGENALSELQEAFIQKHSVQCGFCIPGMIIAGESILAENINSNRMKIQRDLAGNICRCTGYQKIIDAVESVGNQN
ncbi:(2Fe-2S)-binding protein [Candidatus Neomarinimicrobiota bacterium]